MSTNDRGTHQRIEELVAVDALGGLDQDERTELLRELAAHGTDCDECRRLVTEYREVAGHLALALEPAPLGVSAEERLLASVDAPEAADSGPAPAAVRVGRAGRARRWTLVAAAAAALAAAAAFAGFAVAPRSDQAVSAMVLDFLWEPGTRFVSLPGEPGQQLAVAFHPRGGKALVLGRNLAPPPPGMVYELWYRPAGDSAMHPAGTFVPNDGSVTASGHVGTAVSALAVTLEPEGGSDHPTRAPIFAVTV